MSDSGDFDDVFGDIWGDEEFAKFFENQRKVERIFREYAKNLIETFNKGDVQSKSQLIPIEKPGIRGFIFHKEFGNSGTPEHAKQEPRIVGETDEGEQGFTLPESTRDEERAPVLETFINGDEFVALVELPGLEEQDISLEIGENLIEVGAMNFKTTQINVPSNADTSMTTKTYKNGVLEIRVPLISEVRRDEEVRFGVA